MEAWEDNHGSCFKYVEYINSCVADKYHLRKR